MVRKKKTTFILSMLLVTGVIMAGSGAAVAYLTDYSNTVNKFKTGNNTTEISEDFPNPDPLEPGKDATITKLVEILNDNSDGNSVPCYVRAKVYYSTSDLGTYTIEGMSSKWVLGSDGYYYYTEVLEPGEKTEPFMKSVKIDASTADTIYAAELEHFNINVYEESYQAKNPDTQEYMTWQEAWSSALHTEITAASN